MSKSLKKLLVKALLLGAIFFMGLSVYYKLFDYKEGWFTYSLMMSVSWAIGYFVSKTISENMNKGIIEVIFVEVVISFCVIVVMLFIIGVIISLPHWKYVFANTCVPFVISLLLNNKW